MAERSQDWMRQSEVNLRMAHSSLDSGFYEWSAFASHQAADFRSRGPASAPTVISRYPLRRFWTARSRRARLARSAPRSLPSRPSGLYRFGTVRSWLAPCDAGSMPAESS